jgi:hypothetical protein
LASFSITPTTVKAGQYAQLSYSGISNPSASLVILWANPSDPSKNLLDAKYYPPNVTSWEYIVPATLKPGNYVVSLIDTKVNNGVQASTSVTVVDPNQQTQNVQNNPLPVVTPQVPATAQQVAAQVSGYQNTSDQTHSVVSNPLPDSVLSLASQSQIQPALLQVSSQQNASQQVQSSEPTTLIAGLATNATQNRHILLIVGLVIAGLAIAAVVLKH